MTLWHDYVWRVPFLRVAWRILMYDMTPSHVWHDSSTYVTWFLVISSMTHSYVWHDFLLCVARLCTQRDARAMRDMSRLPVTSVTWLILSCGMSPSYVWHDPFPSVTWRFHVCDMTLHTEGCLCRERHDSFNGHMRDMTHSYVWHVSTLG